jgi:CelD/BcsL family acetyltransferase involved in cellulose biosynthesis
VLAGGSAAATALPALHRDVLYDRYRAVHARAFELNVFPLPRRLIDAVLESSAFEIVVLRLADRPLSDGGEDIVAFAVQHVSADHVAPLFVGLDYAYVPTHSSYQVLLLQALRAAQRRGSRRVLLGMGADLHKARFGARREKRWAYVAPNETYNADVLAHIAETVPAR